MFFTLISSENVLFLHLANCVCDESCRETLGPMSPNGFNIQYAAVNSAHLSILSNVQLARSKMSVKKLPCTALIHKRWMACSSILEIVPDLIVC